MDAEHILAIAFLQCITLRGFVHCCVVLSIAIGSIHKDSLVLSPPCSQSAAQNARLSTAMCYRNRAAGVNNC